MRPSRLLLILLLIIGGLSSVFSQVRGGARGGGQGGRPGTEGGPAPFMEVEVTERYHSISAGGRLKPKIRVEHQATAAGIVIDVYVRPAQEVAPGQNLFSIERDSSAGSFRPAVVTSRIAGIVSKISVQAKDKIAVGQNSVTVIGTGGYILEATISDKDAFKVRIGEEITGHTADDVTLRGRLTGRSVEPDYDTGLFFLTFEFPEGQDTHVGEFVMVDLPVDRTLGIFVSRELLVRRYGKFFLWIVNDENLLEIREVATGAVIGDEVHILEGIAEGDRYLTRLTGREKEGTPLGGAKE
jgi:multidrug efflux pump subunit AcrA (membrane-fusion protein)